MTSSTTDGLALGLQRLAHAGAVAVDHDFLDRRCLSSASQRPAHRARAAPLRPNSAMATAVPTKVDLAILINFSPHCY